MSTLPGPLRLSSGFPFVGRESELVTLRSLVPWADGVPAEDYAEAGVTWLVQSTWPKDEGWVEELWQLARNSPAS